jgi:hypothetical protein
MTSKVKNDSKPSHDETVTKAVTEYPGATIAGPGRVLAPWRSRVRVPLQRVGSRLDTDTRTRQTRHLQGGEARVRQRSAHAIAEHEPDHR